MYGFTLNHQTTSSSLGLRLTGPVELPVARRVVEDVEVIGRAGTLTRLGGWEDTRIILPLAVKGGPEAYRQASIQLMQASTISFTTDPGVFRRVKYVHINPLRQELSSWSLFDAEVICEPFSYLYTGLEAEVLGESGQVLNPGMIESHPLIGLSGTGVLVFQINDTTHTITSPSGHIMIDSRHLLTHSGGRVQTDTLTGAFPTFKPGPNHVRLGKGITSFTYQGNWRNP